MRKLLYFLLIICLVLCGAYYYRYYDRHSTKQAQYHNPLPQLNKNQFASLHPTIQKMLNDKTTPSRSLLLRINNQQAEFYNIAYHLQPAPNRREKLCELIYSMQDKYALPDGDYIFTFDDGMLWSHPWPVLTYAAPKQIVEKGDAILFPDVLATGGYDEMFAQIDIANQLHPWQDKENKIFWRGSPSGPVLSGIGIMRMPRVKFLQAAKSLDFVDAGFSAHKNLVNRKDLPAGFLTEFPEAGFVKPEDSLNFKYLMSIDGYTCSYSRMAWILYSNSVMMKHESDDIQWYFEYLKPYQHYIPIAKDFSDLHAQFIWAQQNPEQVLQIALESRKLALEIFSKDNIELAMLQALQNYQLVAAARENVK